MSFYRHFLRRLESDFKVTADSRAAVYGGKTVEASKQDWKFALEFCLTIAILSHVLLPQRAFAENLLYPFPGFNPATSTGYTYHSGPILSETGHAVVSALRVTNGFQRGLRAIRWKDGDNPKELLPFDESPFGTSRIDIWGVSAINQNGDVAGTSQVFEGGATDGGRPALWFADSPIPTLIPRFQDSEHGPSIGSAFAARDDGAVLGSQRLYVGGTDLGIRPTLWDPVTGITHQLGVLNTSAGYTEAGVDFVRGFYAFGRAYDYSNPILGVPSIQPVRWNTITAEPGLPPTRLAFPRNTGTDRHGYGEIADGRPDGVSIGTVERTFFQNGNHVGGTAVAVRWNEAGSPTILESFAPYTTSGGGSAYARAINANGDVVGHTEKGAVHWSRFSTTPRLLKVPQGTNQSYALDVGNQGIVVGNAIRFGIPSSIPNMDTSSRAMLWFVGDNILESDYVDLNSLPRDPDPDGGRWHFTEATAVNKDGLIGGLGIYTTRAGFSYLRAWLMQIGLGGTWGTGDYQGLDGSWTQSSKWSTGTPATNVGTATFSADAMYRVTLERDEHAKHIAVENGVVTFALSDYTLTSEQGFDLRGGTTKIAGQVVGDVHVSSGAILSPGQSPGTLHVDGNFTSAGILDLEVTGNAIDRVVVDGDVHITGLVRITLDYSVTSPITFNFIDANLITGMPSFDLAPLASHFVWDTSSFLDSGQIRIAFAVPEPAAMALAALGVCSVLLRRI